MSGISSGENLYEIVDIFGDLLNSCPAPFEIALHDIVEALPNENGELYITRIVKRSGYKVLRLMSIASSTCYTNLYQGELAKQFCKKLIELGCLSLISMASFWIVHIPSYVDPQTVLNYIKDAQIPLAVVE
ncbi:MAG: DUF4265 domain-containing protein [Hydrococcus sp. C42_A2020_068]|uniref:DUF4265 domain-containing protein n=1 Tax=Pleurocapsa sp. PCC 7327 TaxID=118163 RepID=UPI00029F888C|nr:hypothetical protein Ple7327_0967 [Pleurocapsa sp. PCC 7327]MBF2018809.1 DUF4265 domain-containing protein [Hydrococcus sp. C42_A2020_068]